MSKVVIVQRVLPHYRHQFFIDLHERLGKDGIALELIYGDEKSGTVPRTKHLDVSWSTHITNTYFCWSNTEVIWQPFIRHVRDADLVVVEHSARLITNLAVHLKRIFGKTRMAYWGHGRNMQAGNHRSMTERLKRVLGKHVDWWFAYTELSARHVVELGFPGAQVSTVNNSIDTSDFARAGNDGHSQERYAEPRYDLGLSSNNIGLYCGGMYAEKRLSFLLDACELVRKRVPDFELVLIGSGPDSDIVTTRAESCPWLHYVGEKFGTERIEYFRASRALLIPGLVGLAIIDSFAAGTPLITTDVPFHSPEIEYLEDGHNGLMGGDSLSEYVETIAKFYDSADLRQHLVDGCAVSAAQYSLGAMVDEFAAGITRCLQIASVAD